MPVVKLSYGERFLNWYPTHTKLYIRGQKGKDWNEQRALDSELAREINGWVRKQVEEALAEAQAKGSTLDEDPCPNCTTDPLHCPEHS